MDELNITVLKKENNNLLAVILYMYDDHEFLQSNVKFLRECLFEWHSTYKIIEK